MSKLIAGTLATVGVAAGTLFVGGLASAQEQDGTGGTSNATVESDRADKRRSVADIIGIEPAELSQAMEEGSTLAEIAEANGVGRDELVDALVAQATERIEARVDADPADRAEHRDHRRAHRMDRRLHRDGTTRGVSTDALGVEGSSLSL